MGAIGTPAAVQLVLLTRNGNGHVSYFASSCAETTEDSYLINLKLPADGYTCSS